VSAKYSPPLGMLIQRIRVQQYAGCQEAPTSSVTTATAPCMLLLLTLLASLNSLLFAGAANSTVPTPGEDAQVAAVTSALPVSGITAICIMVGAVVGVCVCLIWCARSQMKLPPKGARGESRERDSTGLGANMQAKIAAARKGWRKTDTFTPAVPGAGGFVGGARSAPAPAPPVNHSELQRIAQTLLGGGGWDGLGVCRYEAMSPDDLLAVWATDRNIEALRKSGQVLAVILAARMSMDLSLLTAVVPFALSITLLFSSMILSSMTFEDYYGLLHSLQLSRCLTLTLCGLGVHLIAYGLARVVYQHDRSVSVAKDKEVRRLAALRQPQRQESFAGTAPSAEAISRSFKRHHRRRSATPNAFSSGNALPISNPLSPTRSAPPGATISNSQEDEGLLTIQPLRAAATVSNSVLGKDSPRWPLQFFCLTTVLSYALLGFQSYVSFDESIGRQYEVTDTPRALWPEEEPKGPFITFILCLTIGTVALVPVILSMRLLAALWPREVHPNLLPPPQVTSAAAQEGNGERSSAMSPTEV
jgi:hypothetical protein